MSDFPCPVGRQVNVSSLDWTLVDVLQMDSFRLTDSFFYYIKRKANNIVYQNANLLTLTNALILTNKLHGYCRLDFGSEKG